MRRLAEAGDSEALLALARFGRPADRPLVDTLRDVDKVRFFQLVEKRRGEGDRAFLVSYARQLPLQREHYSNEWRYFYRAIAAYEDAFAVDLLQLMLARTRNKPMRRYHLEFMFDAVSEHRIDAYKDIFLALWSEGKQTSVEVIDFLLELAPTRTRLAIQNETQNMGAYFSNERAAEHMIRLDLRFDRESAIGRMATNILVTNVHVFQVYAQISQTVQDPRLEEAFVGRLETEDNMHIRHAAQDALRLYQ